jgi:hypothetical protein
LTRTSERARLRAQQRGTSQRVRIKRQTFHFQLFHVTKPFRRNIAKYKLRDTSRAAKALNTYMANAHEEPQPDYICYNGDALKPIRNLTDEEGLEVLLLGYEHFLWLLDPPASLGPKFGDNIYYASGLDFAIQTLARRRLPFTSDTLGRLVRVYLTHPGATPCLPPHIIVGLIVKQAGALARKKALNPETKRLLSRVAIILRKWDREENGSMPPSLLRRLEKAL